MIVLLVLLMLGCVSETNARIGCMFCCDCGEWNKADLYLFVGEYIEMNCTLTDETVDHGDDSSKLYFTYGNDLPVPDNETFIISRTTMGMRSLITSVFNRAYYCNLKNMVHVKNDFVDTTRVYSEHHPQAVTKFNCIIYDWDERMICSWELGVNYRKINDINTTLLLESGGYCQNISLLNCTWNKEQNKAFDRSTLQFEVIVTNKKRGVSNSTGQITINQENIVKPRKVDSFSVRPVSSSCASLQWTHYKRNRTKIYDIYISSKWNDTKVLHTADTNATVCDLKPYTQYEFSIETRPDMNAGYPSDPVVNYTVTDIAQPDQSPEVSMGAYLVKSMDCTDNQRDIIVYWKALHEIFQNGPMRGYSITATYGASRYNTTSESLTQSLTLPCEEESTVSIRSWNKAGYSTESSTIIIPQAGALLPPTRIIIEAQNVSTGTTVAISWNSVDLRGLKSYTVYHCKYDTECTSEIEWVTVGIEQSSILIDITDFNQRYRFGVAVSGDKYSSGFKWETCYYLKNLVPLPPSSVDVQAYPKNSITVTWSEPKCEESPYIAFYRVTWCPSNFGSNKCLNAFNEKMIPSSEVPRHVIGNLVKKTTYGIRVQQVTGDGRFSDFSAMMYAQPTNNDLTRAEIAGISVSGVILFILTIAGALFVIRRTSRGLNKIKKPFVIQTIHINKTVSEAEETPVINGTLTNGALTGYEMSNSGVNPAFEEKEDSQHVAYNEDSSSSAKSTVLNHFDDYINPGDIPAVTMETTKPKSQDESVQNCENCD